ncbi:MAG TPA: ABC transporter ATP-binding protein [Bacillota bacterium]|nr:ABC transporter ATP-binding protein [Bacillota bacterium]
MQLLKSEFFRVMEFMRPRILRYSFGILGMSVFYASITVVEAFLIKQIIDASIQRNSTMLVQGMVMVSAATVAIMIFIPVFQFMYNRYAKTALANVRRTVFAHRGKLPIAYFEKHHSGSLVSRLLYDTENMSGLYTARIRRLTYPFIYGTACIVPMYILDWKISSVLVLGNLVSLYLNTLYSKPIRELSGKIQEAAGVMTENLLNILAGIQMIKLFAIGEIIRKRYANSNAEHVALSIRRSNLGASLSGVNYLLGMLNNLGLLAVGAFLVAHHVTTFGTLFALMNLQRRLNQAFLQIGEYIPQVHDSLAGANRVFEYLDETVEPKRYGMADAALEDRYLEIRDVDFGYEKNNLTLNGLNLSASQGQTIALVGPSGGGKSTVIKLLLGFYPPKSGTIVVAGKSLGQRSLRELRELISYVPQDAYIYNGTIAENIQYGKLDASMEQVIAAAKAANAHAFIMEQPNGYQTIVGERGGRLSGGQRQRIAIARAILKDSPILLLDEATSALDSESEQLVKAALDNLMKNRTTVVVAHRLSTVEHADIIYVIDQGKVVEQGTHRELLNLNGSYQSLYDIQFENRNFNLSAQSV